MGIAALKPATGLDLWTSAIARSGMADTSGIWAGIGFGT